MYSLGAKLTATVNEGFIYTSTDFGRSWLERQGAGSRGWGSISCSHDGNKLVAGVWTGGFIYTSDSGGEHWREHASAGDKFWSSSAMSGDGSKVAMSAYSSNIHTAADYTYTDSWTAQLSAAARWWRGNA